MIRMLFKAQKDIAQLPFDKGIKCHVFQDFFWELLNAKIANFSEDEKKARASYVDHKKNFHERTIKSLPGDGL